MPDRRTQLLDAALAVVADKGMKGLTHRAVDAAAELAEGTTSNYYRNRATLVDAVLDRLLDSWMPDCCGSGGGRAATERRGTRRPAGGNGGGAGQAACAV